MAKNALHVLLGLYKGVCWIEENMHIRGSKLMDFRQAFTNKLKYYNDNKYELLS